MSGKTTNPFLSDFDYNQIISYFDVKEFHTFNKGCNIYSQNAPADCIHFILSGNIEIRKSSKINTVSLGFAGPGHLLGLEDVLTVEKYSNSAFAMERTNTFSVEKKIFFNNVKRNVELKLWILRYLSRRTGSCR